MTDYRHYVGPTKRWDIMAAHQFNVAVREGLRDRHQFLDVGCGALRGGRLFIPYLEKGHYSGIEPATEVYEAALAAEGWDALVDVRQALIRTGVGMESIAPDLFDGRAPFDFVMAQSIFTHFRPPSLHSGLEALRSVSTRSTVVLATVWVTSTTKTVREGVNPLVYPGLTGFSERDYEAVARKHGWKVDWLRIKHPSKHRWSRLTLR